MNTLTTHVTYFYQSYVNSSNQYCTSNSKIPFQLEIVNNFFARLYARIQSKRDAAKQSQYSKTKESRNSIPKASRFQSVHNGYWLSSLRLRSEVAQLVIRLQSWALASREVELCNCVVAQRSLVRTASSASCSAGRRAVLCGQTEGRVGARAGGDTGAVGEGTAGGSRRALPPAAAPSQCSGLG